MATCCVDLICNKACRPLIFAMGQAVAERMASELTDVRLGCVVDKITWGSQGVSITCKDGQSFDADAVIVTVSLGVLKVRITLLNLKSN